MTFRLARSGRAGASRGDLLSGLLLGALEGSADGGRTRGNWYGVPVEKRGELLADARELRILRSLYAGEVSYADQQVGRLLAALRSLGLLERTLVVLTSDHGESLTEHGYYFDHSVELYDADLRVPLLLRLPRRQWAGSRLQRLSGLTDVTPTVLDLLGLPIPRRVGGAPLLREPREGRTGRHATARGRRHVPG